MVFFGEKAQGLSLGTGTGFSRRLSQRLCNDSTQRVGLQECELPFSSSLFSSKLWEEAPSGQVDRQCFRFTDYVVECILLRGVDGMCIFMHRLLKYFAVLRTL
jgi:hypothetical protein